MHLKSLSLDVIFSRRLEMWKAAVLMVAARRGPAGGREYGGAGAPCPASPRGLRSPDRNSSPRPAPPRRRRAPDSEPRPPPPPREAGGGPRGAPPSRLGVCSCRGRPSPGLHTPGDGELTTYHRTAPPCDTCGSTAPRSAPLSPYPMTWARGTIALGSNSSSSSSPAV